MRREYFLLAVFMIMAVAAVAPVWAKEPAVIIDSSMLSCQQDSDCVLVDNTCSGCCGYVAINTSLLPEYNDKLKSACADYHGAVCECYQPKNIPACIDQKCVLLDEAAVKARKNP